MLCSLACLANGPLSGCPPKLEWPRTLVRLVASRHLSSAITPFLTADTLLPVHPLRNKIQPAITGQSLRFFDTKVLLLAALQNFRNFFALNQLTNGVPCRKRAVVKTSADARKAFKAYTANRFIPSSLIRSSPSVCSSVWSPAKLLSPCSTLIPSLCLFSQDGLQTRRSRQNITSVNSLSHSSVLSPLALTLNEPGIRQ